MENKPFVAIILIVVACGLGFFLVINGSNNSIGINTSLDSKTVTLVPGDSLDVGSVYSVHYAGYWKDVGYKFYVINTNLGYTYEVYCYYGYTIKLGEQYYKIINVGSESKLTLEKVIK